MANVLYILYYLQSYTFLISHQKFSAIFPYYSSYVSSIILFIQRDMTNKKSLRTSAVPWDNKRRLDSQHECPHTYPRRMIRCYFQHIPIYYFLLPSLAGEAGESRVMRDIWYKVGTQLRYAIFFFQRTMVRQRRYIFLRRWLDIFLKMLG